MDTIVLIAEYLPQDSNFNAAVKASSKSNLLCNTLFRLKPVSVMYI